MATKTKSETFNYSANRDWHKLPKGMTLHETPGVAVAPDDTVYLLTRNTEAPVMVFSKAGKFLRTWGKGAFTNRTHAIYAPADGFIYAADDGSHTITKWTTDGKLLMTIGTPGKPSPRYSGKPFNRCTDVVVASDGTLFISDGYGNARIHHYSADGKLLHSWGEAGIEHGQFLIPHNLGIYHDRLYVADREANRVQVFDGDGTLLDVWPNIHRPCALTVGPDGNIYVGELTGVANMDDALGVGHRVSVFDRGGRLVGRFGAAEEGSAPGQFIAPHGIAVDSRGDVYVGEVSWTIRGQHMTPPRELPSLTKLTRTK